MKGCFCSKEGFTLIELLVVVLIIGILAAVAVPQYQLAVRKAQFAKLRVLADSIIQAAVLYHTANGDWASKFSQLDIELPKDLRTQTQHNEINCLSNDSIYCCIGYPKVVPATVACGKSDLSFLYMQEYQAKKSICSQNADIKLCETLPNARNKNPNAYAITPHSVSTKIRYDID